MRQKRDPQRNLLYLMARNKLARELEAISKNWTPIRRC